MADDPRTNNPTAAFDAMLADARRRFDALLNGGGAPSKRGAAAAGDDALPGTEAARRFLDDRYGPRWRFEIAERRRENGEAVVLGRLSIDEAGVARAQFGSAPIAGAGNGLAGTVGGVAFSAGVTAPRPSDAEAEKAAFARAAADALRKCVDLL